MKTVENKRSFLIHGIINIVIHIPVLIGTSFWGLFLIGILRLVFGLESLASPFWLTVSLFPMLIPIVSCVIGIIRSVGAVKRDKFACCCLILSIVGVLLYIVMLLICYRIGSVA